MDRIEAHRKFFADLMTASVGSRNEQLTAALASTPRERFLGPGPWKIFAGGGYVITPTDDPAFLYQDVVVALQEKDRINNGQPTLHTMCLSTLDPQAGETAIHVGTGSGYYTALLAQLTGPSGKVHAYEIEPALAERATANLADLPQVTVHARSGAEGPLPPCNVMYVSAGATAPLDIWLNALLPGGRLLFPLTPDGPGGTPAAGGMLLITRNAPDLANKDKYDARFLMPVMFIPCAGARDEETAAKLAEAFKRGDMRNVRALYRNNTPTA
ncbi:MAG TPA: protein-L-isoaspartate(D-aspartate) O-methyltransferase, partial [Candidatus Angelobacter sp.]|nr:protein-L-isoaspartate(D-aspartate) O-methyltransferase [Candidatus Angelobacter sp.]